MNLTRDDAYQFALTGVLPVGAYQGPLLELLEKYSTLPGWDPSVSVEAEAVKAQGGTKTKPFGDLGFRWKGRYGWMLPEWGQEGAECGGACVEKQEGAETLVVPLMCGMWICPVCGYRRWMWFYRNLKAAITRDNLLYFWTLTIDTKTCTPEESYTLIKEAWNKLRGRLKRKNYGLKFVWVLESTKNGYAHLHVVMNTYVDHGWMSRAWKDSSKGSYVVWVKKLDNAGAAGYMAKYLAESEKHAADRGAGDALAGQHRFGRSRDVEWDPFHKPARGWEVVAVPFKERLGESLAWDRVLRGSWVGAPVYLEEAFKSKYRGRPKTWSADWIGADQMAVAEGGVRDG